MHESLRIHFSRQVWHRFSDKLRMLRWKGVGPTIFHPKRYSLILMASRYIAEKGYTCLRFFLEEDIKSVFLSLIIFLAWTGHLKAAVLVNITYTPVLMHVSPDNRNIKIEPETFLFILDSQKKKMFIMNGSGNYYRQSELQFGKKRVFQDKDGNKEVTTFNINKHNIQMISKNARRNFIVKVETNGSSICKAEIEIEKPLGQKEFIMPHQGGSISFLEQRIEDVTCEIKSMVSR